MQGCPVQADPSWPRAPPQPDAGHREEIQEERTTGTVLDTPVVYHGMVPATPATLPMASRFCHPVFSCLRCPSSGLGSSCALTSQSISYQRSYLVYSTGEACSSPLAAYLCHFSAAVPKARRRRAFSSFFFAIPLACAGCNQLVYLQGNDSHPGGQNPPAGGGQPGGPGLEAEWGRGAGTRRGRVGCAQAHAPECIPNKVILCCHSSHTCVFYEGWSFQAPFFFHSSFAAS